MATVDTEPAIDEQGFGPFRAYRLTEEQYLRLAETGVIPAKAPVFLWKGLLVEKMTKGRRHSLALVKLCRLVYRLVPEEWFVQPEQPIALGGGTLPEPDLTIVRGAFDDYRVEPPRPRDLGLVVEIADSSLRDDATGMLTDYAHEAIPIYWIVNIPKQRFDVYSRPTGPSATPAYEEIRSYFPGDEVPLILDGLAVGKISVSDVL